jgi:hypothetical protein
MVAPAENFVGDFCARGNIAHNDLFAFCDHYSAEGSRIMSRSRSTPTERFNLQSIHTISEFYQSRRAWKELGAKICQDTKCEDINTQTINDLCKLFDLF